jgi:hypothetical protein
MTHFLIEVLYIRSGFFGVQDFAILMIRSFALVYPILSLFEKHIHDKDFEEYCKEVKNYKTETKVKVQKLIFVGKSFKIKNKKRYKKFKSKQIRSFLIRLKKTKDKGKFH